MTWVGVSGEWVVSTSLMVSLPASNVSLSSVHWRLSQPKESPVSRRRRLERGELRPGAAFIDFLRVKTRARRETQWYGQPGLLQRTSPVIWRHNITLHLALGGCEWQDQRMVLTDQLYCHPIHSLWEAVSEVDTKMIMTPWEDLFFVINNLLLGEEPVSTQRILRDLDLILIFSVDRGLHPAGGDQCRLRSLHPLVLLSNRTQGQPGRIWTPLHTGNITPVNTTRAQPCSSDSGRGVRRQVQAAGPEPRVQEDGGRAGAGPVRDEHLIAASRSSHCCIGCCLEEQFSQNLFTFLK